MLTAAAHDNSGFRPKSREIMSPLYLLPLLAAVAAAGHYTNEWAVKISGDEAEAERVAKELNCVVKGQFVEFTTGKEGLFVFKAT